MTQEIKIIHDLISGLIWFNKSVLKDVQIMSIIIAEKIRYSYDDPIYKRKPKLSISKTSNVELQLMSFIRTENDVIDENVI